MKVDELIKQLQDLRNNWGNLDVYCDPPKGDILRLKNLSVEGSLPDYACITIETE
jgi:hypothetical protein